MNLRRGDLARASVDIVIFAEPNLPVGKLNKGDICLIIHVFDDVTANDVMKKALCVGDGTFGWVVVSWERTVENRTFVKRGETYLTPA
jgi:hypothetical protein